MQEPSLRPPVDTLRFQSVDPTSGVTWKSFSALSEIGLQASLVGALDAQRSWRLEPVNVRARVLENLAELLEKRKDPLSRLLAREMGKPLIHGFSEIAACVRICRQLSSGAEAWFTDPERLAAAAEGDLHTLRRPLGVLLGLFPSDFPFWQAMRVAVPAVLAGNAILLCGGKGTPACSLELTVLFEDAGIPQGLMASLLLPPKDLLRLVGEKGVRSVSLDGGWRHRRSIDAAAARNGTPVVSGLLTQNLCIVLGDADLDRAASFCAGSCLAFGGQGSGNLHHIVVTRSALSGFLSRLAQGMAEVPVGDPFDLSTRIGPMPRKQLQTHLHWQIGQAVAGGAEILLGGEMSRGPGFFYLTTVLVASFGDLRPLKKHFCGPVAVVVPVEDRHQAFRAVGDGWNGGCVVFTEDPAAGPELAWGHPQIAACAVNGPLEEELCFPGPVEDPWADARRLCGYDLATFSRSQTARFCRVGSG